MFEVVPEFAPKTLATPERLQERIEELKRLQEEANRDIATTRMTSPMGSQMAVFAQLKESKRIAEDIRELEGLYKKTSDELGRLIGFVTDGEKATAAFRKEANKAKAEIEDLESKMRIAADGGMKEYEERIGDLEDALAGGFAEERIRVPFSSAETTVDTEEAIERMKAAYADFLVTLKKIVFCQGERAGQQGGTKEAQRRVKGADKARKDRGKETSRHLAHRQGVFHAVSKDSC